MCRVFPVSHSSGSFDQICDDEFIMTKVLENTGWYLMKIMKQVNVHYKFGNPTSNRSPGHAHSDSMSINIYSNNHPILVSSGTHSYSRARQYERSGSSPMYLEFLYPSKAVNFVKSGLIALFW